MRAKYKRLGDIGLIVCAVGVFLWIMALVAGSSSTLFTTPSFDHLCTITSTSCEH